jgi:hypothetical protein
LLPKVPHSFVDQFNHLGKGNILARQPSNATKVAVGALKNRGCIALDHQGVFEPTRDLRLALPDI